MQTIGVSGLFLVIADILGGHTAHLFRGQINTPTTATCNYIQSMGLDILGGRTAHLNLGQTKTPAAAICNYLQSMG